jgi:hypothetical protein
VGFHDFLVSEQYERVSYDFLVSANRSGFPMTS